MSSKPTSSKPTAAATLDNEKITAVLLETHLGAVEKALHKALQDGSITPVRRSMWHELKYVLRATGTESRTPEVDAVIKAYSDVYKVIGDYHACGRTETPETIAKWLKRIAKSSAKKSAVSHRTESAVASGSKALAEEGSKGDKLVKQQEKGGRGATHVAERNAEREAAKKTVAEKAERDAAKKAERDAARKAEHAAVTMAEAARKADATQKADAARKADAAKKADAPRKAAMAKKVEEHEEVRRSREQQRQTEVADLLAEREAKKKAIEGQHGRWARFIQSKGQARGSEDDAEKEDVGMADPGVRPGSSKRKKPNDSSDSSEDHGEDDEEMDVDVEKTAGPDADTDTDADAEGQSAGTNGHRLQPEKGDKLHDPPCAKCKRLSIPCVMKISRVRNVTRRRACHPCAGKKQKCDWGEDVEEAVAAAPVKPRPTAKTKAISSRPTRTSAKVKAIETQAESGEPPRKRIKSKPLVSDDEDESSRPVGVVRIGKPTSKAATSKPEANPDNDADSDADSNAPRFSAIEKGKGRAPDPDDGASVKGRIGRLGNTIADLPISADWEDFRSKQKRDKLEMTDIRKDIKATNAEIATIKKKFISLHDNQKKLRKELELHTAYAAVTEAQRLARIFEEELRVEQQKRVQLQHTLFNIGSYLGILSLGTNRQPVWNFQGVSLTGPSNINAVAAANTNGNGNDGGGSDAESEEMETDPPLQTSSQSKADTDVVMSHVASADSSMADFGRQMPPHAGPLAVGHPAVALTPATPEASQEQAEYASRTLLPATGDVSIGSASAQAPPAQARSPLLSPPVPPAPSLPPPTVSSAATQPFSLPPPPPLPAFTSPLQPLPTPTPPPCGQPRQPSPGRLHPPPVAERSASETHISPRPPRMQRIPGHRGRGRGRALQVPLAAPRQSPRTSPSPSRSS